MEEELHALVLTLSSTLGLDASRNEGDDQMNDDDDGEQEEYILMY